MDIFLAFCFSAHSRLALRLRSAASSLALRAASSLERRSRSFSPTKLDSRLKISLPRIFWCCTSSELSELLACPPRTLPVEVDVARDTPAVDGDMAALSRPRESEEVPVENDRLGRLELAGPRVECRLAVLGAGVEVVAGASAAVTAIRLIRARLAAVWRGNVPPAARLARTGRALNSRRLRSSSCSALSLASRSSRLRREMASPGSSKLGRVGGLVLAAVLAFNGDDTDRKSVV